MTPNNEARRACELCRYAGAMLPFYPMREIVKCPVCGLVFYAEPINARSCIHKIILGR